MQMMTVKELKHALEQYPDDMGVALYCSLSEDANTLHRAKVVTKETHPYCKGDDVYDIYGLPDQPILMLE